MLVWMMIGCPKWSRPCLCYKPWCENLGPSSCLTMWPLCQAIFATPALASQLLQDPSLPRRPPLLPCLQSLFALLPHQAPPPHLPRPPTHLPLHPQHLRQHLQQHRQQPPRQHRQHHPLLHRQRHLRQPMPPRHLRQHPPQPLQQPRKPQVLSTAAHVAQLTHDLHVACSACQNAKHQTCRGYGADRERTGFETKL